MKLKDANGEYIWNENGEGEDVIFKVYENGDDLTKIDAKGLLAIEYGHKIPNNIPTNIYALLLPDDFEQSLDELPEHITILFLFNVKIKLNSIPTSVKTIYLCNGFSQIINNDNIIPTQIKTIYLGGTLYPLEASAVSNPSLITVYKMLSHKHQIPIRYYYY